MSKRLPKKRRRSIIVGLRLRPEEYRRLKKMAKVAELEVCEVLRLLVDGAWEELISSGHIK